MASTPWTPRSEAGHEEMVIPWGHQNQHQLSRGGWRNAGATADALGGWR